MSTYERKEHQVRKFRVRGIRVTPPLVISMIALFVALAGTGWAQNAVPLAKRALTANKAKVATNALKLNGQTATQIAATPGPATDSATLNGQTAAQIAATPGPTGSLSAGLFNYRTQSFSVDAQGATARDTALCLSGEKAIGGGWERSRARGRAQSDKSSPRPEARESRYGEAHPPQLCG
jgi:hypothetical protein